MEGGREKLKWSTERPRPATVIINRQSVTRAVGLPPSPFGNALRKHGPFWQVAVAAAT